MNLKVGDIFQETYTVDSKIYEGFIDLFHDKNPMHISDEYAISHGYRGKIMHGNILNGFISYFIGESFPIKSVVILGQDIKYYHPIHLNEKILLSMEVANVFESVSTIELKYFFEDSSKKKVAKGKIQVRVG